MTNLESQSESLDPLYGLKQMELLHSPNGEFNVAVSKGVGIGDQERIWSMIGDGFTDLNNRSYQRQSMNKDEFEIDMNSPNVLKYIAYNLDKEPVGFMTIHTGLDDITWINHEELIRRQDEIDPNAESYYIGTLVVPVDLRSKEIAPTLLRAGILHWQKVNIESNRRSLCYFDCAEANYPGLPGFVERIARPSRDFEGVKFEIQEIVRDYWIKNLSTGNTEHYSYVMSDSPNLPEDSSEFKIIDKQHFFTLVPQY